MADVGAQAIAGGQNSPTALAIVLNNEERSTNYQHEMIQYMKAYSLGMHAFTRPALSRSRPRDPIFRSDFQHTFRSDAGPW